MNDIEQELLHAAKTRLLIRIDNKDIAPADVDLLAHAYLMLSSVQLIEPSQPAEG